MVEKQKNGTPDHYISDIRPFADFPASCPLNLKREKRRQSMEKEKIKARKKSKFLCKIRNVAHSNTHTKGREMRQECKKKGYRQKNRPSIRYHPIPQKAQYWRKGTKRRKSAIPCHRCHLQHPRLLISIFSFHPSSRLREQRKKPAVVRNASSQPRMDKHYPIPFMPPPPIPPIPFTPPMPFMPPPRFMPFRLFIPLMPPPIPFTPMCANTVA